MRVCENQTVNHYEPINYCSTIDDFRPTQSTLLTRFTTTEDCSDLWRTTNQDYGAFYYRQISQYCTPDNLKAKLHRRHHRFQEWISYQTKRPDLGTSLTKNLTNNNDINQGIFPLTRNETVRITHRRKLSPNCDENDQIDNDQCNRNSFSECGEDGLITEYIVKKILHKLQYLISPDEHQDVAECAQLLVSEILSQDPSLYINEIIDRVINIMTNTPNDNNMESSISGPCYSDISTKLIYCPDSQQSNDNSQTVVQTPVINSQIFHCPPVNPSVPFNNCNENMSLSNVFDKLAHLENAISRVSNQLVKS